jgi:ABC-2 type transport system permease protein
MNAIRNTLAVARKEIQVLLKDRGSLAVLFILPILFGSLYGFMNLQSAREEGDDPTILLDVALVNEDEGTFGKEIARALRAIDELEIKALSSPESAERLVLKGMAAAAIVIPPDLSQNIDAYTPTTIEVIVDPAQPESASIVTGIMGQVAAETQIWGEVQYGIRTILAESGALADTDAANQRAIEAQNLGVIMTRLNAIRSSPAIAIVAEELEGEGGEGGIGTFFALMFPGITIMFVFFIVGVAGSSLLGEREKGTLRRLLAAPIPRGSVMAGKTLAYMVLVCLQVGILFAVASIAFGMPLGRSPVGLALLTVVLAFTATAMGLMIAALAKSAKQADSLGTVLGFVLAGIGGCIAMGPVPLTRLGGVMGVVSRLTPHSHALEGYYQLMGESAALITVLPEIGILLAMGVAFFAIAVWRFRYE